MKIYIGNLGRETTGTELRRVFERYGTVSSVAISYDQTDQSGNSRGFAYVNMPDELEAQAAINGLNGHQVNGRLAIVW